MSIWKYSSETFLRNFPNSNSTLKEPQGLYAILSTEQLKVDTLGLGFFVDLLLKKQTNKKHVFVKDILILNKYVQKHIHKNKDVQSVLYQEKVKQNLQRVNLSANPAIIKVERTQAKFAENEEQRAEIYREATLDYTQTTSDISKQFQNILR